MEFRMISWRAPRWIVHVALAMPLALLLGRWAMMAAGSTPREAGLSVDPVAFTINFLGDQALRALWLTLLVTPLRRWSGWNGLAGWRRPLGLWCFTYATLHLAIYIVLDQSASLSLLIADVAKHPFILLGMTGWLMLVPLAITSNRRSILRLGARGWQKLHHLVYIVGAVVAVHYILRVKGFQIEPWVYAGILTVLLAARVRWRGKLSLPSGLAFIARLRQASSP